MRTFQWRDAQFNQAIAEYKVATGKDLSDVLNRGLRNVGFKTAQATPKESTAQIEADMRKDKLALKIATKQLRGRIGKTFTTKKGKVRTVKRVTRKQIGRKAKQLISKRKKRRGFLRAGWIAAMIAAGISGVRRGDIIRGGSKIGSGRQATPARLRAYLGNAAWGRLDGPAQSSTKAKMLSALKTGMRLTAKDMMDYAQKEMRKTARRYSASRRRR